ncbi:NAD(+)/NADH kinase [Halobacteria archaeon AArc-curdl1]|uniref:NAD kinase n=1 Tax=Natronosalvus hydrolyticus TaxID=2979988 RepID=A0AAP2ZBP7_9EURY|nr:NAD(+)/NADH kinase [Halobacteria archaeon AArc-curdl1]
MAVTVGIVAQRENERAQQLADSLVGLVEKRGDDVLVDNATAEAIDASGVPVDAMNECAFVVSIGGDGTFLFVAREAGNAPLMGVNLGEVGFLNAVAPADAVDAVTALLEEAHSQGAVSGRSVSRLTARGDNWSLEPALNEVLVHGPRRGPAGGVTVDIAVDGEPYASSWGDGALVATPTGSTAYNLSDGGPLVHPTVDGLVITQMCAADAMPSLVVDGDSEITLTVSDAETAWAISDGRNRQPLAPGETVTVTRADNSITLTGPTVDFFQALEKLE